MAGKVAAFSLWGHFPSAGHKNLCHLTAISEKPPGDLLDQLLRPERGWVPRAGGSCGPWEVLWELISDTDPAAWT